ncbi:MAG: nuclear transport factor 2 family protein [Caulobacteraceae bacterium]
MAFTGPMEDRLAIRERIDAYGDAVFRADPAAWIANWAEGAIWRLPGFEARGLTDIEAAWRGAMGAFRLAAFFAAPGHIVVDGARAEARVHTREILVAGDGAVRRIVGVYADRLIRSGGIWLFELRDYAILHDEKGGAP